MCVLHGAKQRATSGDSSETCRGAPGGITSIVSNGGSRLWRAERGADVLVEFWDNISAQISFV